MTLPEAMRERVLKAARASPATRPAARGPALVGLAVLAAVAMIGVLYLWGGPGHAVGRPASTGAAIVAGIAGLALLATRLVLPPARSMLGPSTTRLLAIAVGVPVVVAVWLLGWHAVYDDPNVRVGFLCFSLTLAAAPWPFVALVFASHRRDPRHPGLSGAALGAAAGAWAAVVVELWCPLAEPRHVAIGHVAPLLALTALGAFLGARLFALRRVRGA
jgi:hypothetical protein